MLAIQGSAYAGVRNVRRLIMVGTALGCSMGVAQVVSAQNISSTGNTSTYTLTDPAPRTGGPRTIDVATSGGDIAIDVGQVDTVNNGNTQGAAIAANNTGPGNTSIRTTGSTATGSGLTYAIDGRATTGTVTIVNTGTVDASGNNADRGIFGQTTTGNIAITSNIANGQTRGISTFGNGTTTINAGTTTANGTGTINAIVAQGERVVLTAGTTSNTNAAGNQGTAIFVNTGAGGALVNAGTTSALGQNQSAIQVFSEGAVDVTSNAVRTTQNSDGLSVQSGTSVVVRSTSVAIEGLNGGSGIVLGGNRGGGGFNGGPDGFGYTSANVTSGSVTTAGVNSYGIYATPNGAGSTTITSNAITTTGSGSTGILVSRIGAGTIGGTTTINTTGALTTGGNAASGVQVNGGTGAVAVANTGTITTSGVSAYAIYLVPGAGAGTTTISGTGAIATSGAGAHGIFVAPAANANTGALSIASGPITTSGTNAVGIFAINAGGPVSIDASDLRTSNSGASAIVVQQTAGAASAINVQAGIVRVTGANTGAAINISSNGTTGPVTIGLTDGQASGVLIDARSVGAVSVTSGLGRSGVGIANGLGGTNASGITAISSGAAATVASTDLQVANGRGIFAQGLNDATVTSGALAVTGANQGIFAQTSTSGAGLGAGTVTVDSTNLSSQAGGINAFGPRATVNVTSGIVTAGNAVGIGAFGLDVSVRSTSVTTGGGSAISAGNANGATRAANLVVDSGTIIVNGTTQENSVALSALGQAIDITSGTVTTSGIGNRGGINAVIATQTAIPNDGSFTGTINITSGSVTTVGDGAYGIRAVADAGAITINSTGTVTTSGGSRPVGDGTFRYSDGIEAVSFNGAINVTSNNVTTTGNGVDGIRVEANSGTAQYAPAANPVVGTVLVTSNGAISASGAQSNGIHATTGASALTIANAGSITTSGATGYGILVTGGSGATRLTSNLVSTSGAGATGILVNNTTSAIDLTATTTRATGLGAGAISLTGGDITARTGTTSATGGTGVAVVAGGAANVTAVSASGGGDGAAGISVTGATGVNLNVVSASSTGATTQAGRADAVFAQATNGAIIAQVGSASAQGAGADGIRLIANGTGGEVTLGVTGTVTSAAGTGIFIDPPGTVAVSIGAQAQVSGATAGLNVTGAPNSITNLGSISGTGGSGIIAAGVTTLDNSGSISGANGTAVQLGATNDTVILRTGSAVTGAILGGGGTDSATLIGGSTAVSASQTVATFRDFATLTVQSGYWTAPANATPSTVAATTVASGATLQLTNGAAGIAGYQTATIADNGDIVLVSDASSGGDTFGATTVSGTGRVRFTGNGTATLAGTNTLTNTGTNTVDAGSTVLVTGTQGGTFVNNGTFQIGTGGTTGAFTGNLVDNGTLIVNRSDTYAFNGSLTGAGTFVKNGAGQVVFGSGYAFTGTTQLNGGSIRLTTPVAATTELDIRGTGTVDLSGQTNTIAELMGTAGGTLNIAGGALTVNQATSTTFAGVIAGAGGSFTKGGTGLLNLTGANTYTGPTTVNGGTLAVNGSITSPVTVATGGTLGGTGTIAGNVTIASGGTYAPGNSIGTQNVTGNVTFAAGSTFAVEANSGGQADRIVATGTATINGGTVAVTATGVFAQGTLYNYNVITANGGVTGRFAGVTSNLAFLSPLLSYGTTAVNLTLARNDVAFGAMAVGPNGLAVAGAVATRPLGDPIFNAILLQSNATAAASFNQLSGELHASVPAVLADGGRRVRELVLNRAAVGEQGLGVWLDGLQTFARSRGQSDYARVRANRTGVYGGADYGSGSLRFGVNGGYVDQQIRVPGLNSSADVDTKLVGASIAYRPAAGRVTVLGGVTRAWHDIATTRIVSVTGLAGTLTGSGKGRSTEAFAELGYTMPFGSVTASPFVRYSHDWTRADALTESGGTAALALGRDKRSADYATLGVRLGGATRIGSGAQLEPKGTLALEHGWGDLRDGRSAAFVTGTGPAFTVTGARTGRDTASADIGADVVLDSGLRFGLSGFGSVARQWRDYGAKATVGFRF